MIIYCSSVIHSHIIIVTIINNVNQNNCNVVCKVIN